MHHILRPWLRTCNSTRTTEGERQSRFSLMAHTEQRAGGGPKSNSTEPPLHFYYRVYSLSCFTAGKISWSHKGLCDSMEKPGPALHAPCTHKLDAGGKPPSKYTPTRSLSSLIPLSVCPSVGTIYKTHTLTHTYSNPQLPTLLFLLAPQLRPCYCCKLLQEWQQLGYSEFNHIYDCFIFLCSCPFN